MKNLYWIYITLICIIIGISIINGFKINNKIKEKFEEKLVDLVLSKHWDFMEKIKCD